MAKKKLSYQEAMDQLQVIVSKLEKNDTNIDELSGLVSQALELVKSCRQKLSKTEEDLNQALEEDK